MELVTLCPHCQTRFTVNVTQLQRRKGYIRCPQCAAIFDGFEQVVPDDQPEPTPVPVGHQTQAAGLHAWQPPNEAPAFAAEPVVDDYDDAQEGELLRSDEGYLDDQIEPEADTVTWISARYEPTEHDSHEPIYSDHDHSPNDKAPNDTFFVSPRESITAREAEPAWRIGGVTAENQEAPLFVASDRLRDDERPYRYDKQHDLPRSLRLVRFFWGVVALILLAVAVVQALYVFRLQIASTVPMTRPLLEALCEQVGCTVPYVRNIADIKVVSSALQVQQAGSGSAVKQYQLRVRLRNSDKQAQEWPTLVVTFTDVAAAVVSRVEVVPEQYLTAQQLEGPFAAQSEIEFVLPVQSATRINGYKIDKYFR